MSTVREKIQLRLKEPENPERRQIALSIQEEKLNQLERIARAMSEHSGRNVSRNMLIDDAIEAYIEEAIQMLTQNDLSSAKWMSSLTRSCCQRTRMAFRRCFWVNISGIMLNWTNGRYPRSNILRYM